MLCPHAHTVPSLLSATACSRPPSICVTPVSPATATKVLVLPPAPFPSWPNSSEPDDDTVPVAATAAPAVASATSVAASVHIPQTARRLTGSRIGAPPWPVQRA